MKSEPITCRLKIRTLGTICRYLEENGHHIKSRNHLLSLALETLEESILMKHPTMYVGTIEDAYEVLSKIGFAKNMKPSKVACAMRLVEKDVIDPVAVVIAHEHPETGDALDALMVSKEDKR